ncbi:SEC-C metal-binding domain-containing protein, partial [Lysobacter sp. A3-1-A15]
LDDNDWIEGIFSLLDQLASGEVLAEDPTAPATPIGYQERLEIIAGLPGMLADLHHHRIEALTPREPIRRADTPERNAPCPCGSGKKYKKCCGT